MVITIYSIPKCSYCEKAVDLAYSNGCEVAIRSAKSLSKKEWEQKIGKVPKTAPQIFIGSDYIGGYNQLKNYFSKRSK